MQDEVEEANRRLEELTEKLGKELDKEHAGTCPVCGAKISGSEAAGFALNDGEILINGRWQSISFRTLSAKCGECGAALTRVTGRTLEEGQIVSTWELDPEKR